MSYRETEHLRSPTSRSAAAIAGSHLGFGAERTARALPLDRAMLDARARRVKQSRERLAQLLAIPHQVATPRSVLID